MTLREASMFYIIMTTRGSMRRMQGRDRIEAKERLAALIETQIRQDSDT